MSLKTESRKLQKFAKEMGYKIKLTHAQEILARMQGYKSRHPLLKEESLEKEKKELRKLDPFFYYEIYVSYGGNEGYSCFFKSKKKCILEQEIVDEGINQGRFNDDDSRYIVYAQEIEKEYYPYLED